MQFFYQALSVKRILGNQGKLQAADDLSIKCYRLRTSDSDLIFTKQVCDFHMAMFCDSMTHLWSESRVPCTSHSPNLPKLNECV